MAVNESEDELLRSVAIQNAQSILLARRRAEEELVRVQAALRESAERLKLALAAGNLGDWSWDARTDTFTLGPRAAEIFGLHSAAPMTWTQLRDLLHEEDRERARLTGERAIAERIDYNVEYRVNRPAGGLCWVAARGRARYAADGSVLGMTGVMQDISERKCAEQALQDETRDLELLNRTGALIASQLDLQSLVQSVTDAAMQLSDAKYGAFFYNVSKPDGESFQLFALSGAPRAAFEKFGLPRNTPVFNATFRGEGVVRSADITRDPRYGKMAPHHGMPMGHLPVRSYLAVPVISRSGEVIGGLLFGHPDADVFTERSERIILGIAAQAAVAIDNARLYDAEQKARARAERMSDLKDEFLATLSHELRTPLSAILGWANVLRRRAMSAADLHNGLDIIERNARVQTKLIEDLLDMSRITSGKVRLDVQPVTPAAVIEAALETVVPAAEAKAVHLEKLLDPRAGPVSGDPDRLQQVVWNLLSNAIKFTPKDGKVRVLLQRVDSNVEIVVADSGIGIKPEFLASVFDRFRQADASTTRRYGGLGLGLSIVKHLVELHGGTVQVASEGEGRGTSVSVRLPLAAIRRAPDVPTFVKAAASLAQPFTPADLSGLKVLVLDDQGDARELMKRVLEDCGAKVLTAAAAGEALALVERERPDLLVSDIGMPDVDGFELLRRVRALGPERGGKIPAIALTAFARSEDRTRALRAGFQVHVSKPVEPSELVATVASVAGRN